MKVNTLQLFVKRYLRRILRIRYPHLIIIEHLLSATYSGKWPREWQWISSGIDRLRSTGSAGPPDHNTSVVSPGVYVEKSLHRRSNVDRNATTDEVDNE